MTLLKFFDYGREMRKKINLVLILIVLICTGCNSKGTQAAEITATEQKNEEVQIPKQPDIREIEVSSTGDIMFHSTQIKSGYNSKTKSYNFEESFSEIEKIMGESDLAIANLETVTAGEKNKYTGYPTFNSPSEVLDGIKSMGIDVLATANNHCLDRGKQGVELTIDEINKRNLENIGTYKEDNRKILIKEVNGIKLGMLAYTYGCNGMEARLTKNELSKMVNIINEAKIKSDLEYLNKQNVDFSVVVIHWGVEYMRVPNESQTKLADKMMDWGADIILGSHPHVIQKSEIVNKSGDDKFIIYSQGNFISNQRTETIDGKNAKYTEDGVIVKLKLQKNMDTNKSIIKKVDYVPTWVYRYSKDGKYHYKVIPINEINMNKYKQVKGKLIQSYNQTMEKMSVYEIEE